MATPTTYASAKRFVNAGVETVQGTAVSTTATLVLDTFTATDEPTFLEDTGRRGSMVDTHDLTQGVRKVTWSAAGAFFPDTFGFFLANILGEVATTGAGAPYTHTFSLLNSGTGQPSSLTLVDLQGPTATSGARTYAGCCVEELTLKGNAESSLIMMEAKGIGYASAAAGSAPTSAPSTESPIAGWRYQLGIGGVAAGGTLVINTSEFEYSLKRAQLTPIYTGQNSQNPYVIQRGELSVTGKYKFVAVSDEAALTYLLDNTKPQTQLLITNGVTPTSGSAYRAIQVDCQSTGFTKATLQRDSAAVGFDTEFKALANTTNAGASGGYAPIQVVLSNALPAASY